MIKELNNYAFIDSQNLNLGIRILGWKLDYARFRNQNKKLEVVLSPNKNFCSNLLTHTAKERIQFMNDLQGKLEYKMKRTA